LAQTYGTETHAPQYAVQCRRINQGQMPYTTALHIFSSERVLWHVQFSLLSSRSFIIHFDCWPSHCLCPMQTWHHLATCYLDITSLPYSSRSCQ